MLVLAAGHTMRAGGAIKNRAEIKRGTVLYTLPL
jgi:hypothetical protein